MSELHVNIGELKLGRGEDVLKASLGSCVGIALLWKARETYALAHCLLAEAPPNAPVNGARYVSHAVPALIALLHAQAGVAAGEVEAVIAGGGNMTAPRSANPKTLVGYLNVQAAEAHLKKHGIKIIYRDVGGETGRKILVDCQTGEFSITDIPRITTVTQ